MKFRLITAGVLVWAILLSVGCWRRVLSEADLYGVYAAKLPEKAAEVWILSSGGKCVQIIMLRDGAVYTANGQWHYNSSHGYISLYNVRESLTATGGINPDVAKISKDTVQTFSVWRAFNGPRIELNEDIRLKKVGD